MCGWTQKNETAWTLGGNLGVQTSVWVEYGSMGCAEGEEKVYMSWWRASLCQTCRVSVKPAEQKWFLRSFRMSSWCLRIPGEGEERGPCAQQWIWGTRAQEIPRRQI